MNINPPSINNNNVVIIDNGSSFMKFGLEGDYNPRIEIPTLVGKNQRNHLKILNKDTFIGDEAQSKRGILSLNKPIERGVIVNWDSMEEVWRYLYKENNPVLLLDSLKNSFTSREKMTEIFFEKFNSPSLHITIQGVASIYSTGRYTGLSIELGESGVCIVPVEQGIPNRNHQEILDVTGQDLTENVRNLLENSGFSFTGSIETELFREIKEKNSYLSLDFENDMKKPKDSFHSTYELPDGQVLDLYKESILIPEPLFKPSLLSSRTKDSNNSNGIHQLLFNCLMKQQKERREYFNNIVLSGGTSMFRNIQERLTNEIRNLVENNIIVNVLARPERKYSALIGGSVFLSLQSFQQNWISKNEYEEFGKSIVSNKFF